MGNLFLYFKTIFFLLLILLSLILLDSYLTKVNAASQSVIINEVMYDPAGTDTGYEWLELYNASSGAINLSGWSVQVAGTSFKTNATLTGQIETESIFLICEPNIPSCDLTVPKLAFQNGGDATDGIQILDHNSVVIDSVLYDSPNSNNLTNETGTILQDTETSPVSGSGESIGRKSYIDTDSNSEDFVAFASPTPGQQNTLPEDEIDEDEELDPTGTNPFLVISLFFFFILLIYSARLIKYYKLNRQNNGNR